MNCVMIGILAGVLIPGVIIMRHTQWSLAPLLNVNLLEIMWTTLPVGVLAMLAVPSLHLLYLLDAEGEAGGGTTKAVGHQ